MTPLAYKLARLISPLHVQFSAVAVGKEDVVLENALKPEFSGQHYDFARLIREGPWPVNETLVSEVKTSHKPVREPGSGRGLVYKASCQDPSPPSIKAV